MALKKRIHSTKRQKVDFSFQANGSKGFEKVILVGDFNQWNAKKHPMKKDKGGMWRKHLFLYPGTYEYKFFADGNWCMDPVNPLSCPNSFGTRNNFIIISDPDN